MEKQIIINTNSEELKKYHRGDVGVIEITYDGKVERHEVRFISKYRLRSGETRVKLVTLNRNDRQNR